MIDLPSLLTQDMDLPWNPIQTSQGYLPKYFILLSTVYKPMILGQRHTFYSMFVAKDTKTMTYLVVQCWLDWLLGQGFTLVSNVS
jgi:hypothetical protein